VNPMDMSYILSCNNSII